MEGQLQVLSNYDIYVVLQFVHPLVSPHQVGCPCSHRFLWGPFSEVLSLTTLDNPELLPGVLLPLVFCFLLLVLIDQHANRFLGPLHESSGIVHANHGGGESDSYCLVPVWQIPPQVWDWGTANIWRSSGEQGIIKSRLMCCDIVCHWGGQGK